MTIDATHLLVSMRKPAAPQTLLWGVAMRLIFVDNQTDRVWGDTAELASTERLDALSSSNDAGGLCKAAARLIDESNGEREAGYVFCDFQPTAGAPGYLVYLVNEGDESALTMAATPTLSDVLTHCFYIGYIRRVAAPAVQVVDLISCTPTPAGVPT